MNHLARLCVYTSCEMSCHPARPPDRTLHAWRQVISAVFKIGAIMESRNCMANEPSANKMLNHHSSVAKHQPLGLTDLRPSAEGGTKSCQRKKVETKRNDRSRHLMLIVSLCMQRGELHSCGCDLALANIHLFTAMVPSAGRMTTAQCQDQKTPKN